MQSQYQRKERSTGLIGKAEEIIQVSEHPLMNGNGNSMAALKLYEAQRLPNKQTGTTADPAKQQIKFQTR